ncbi:hypothetical protein CVV65_04425 [Kyrpidia spormannii]|uniref:DUF1641 domain-containing protein n=2 Tax=Kyrpidia spormannii TaxID=2055160 RepID=A0A2K8N4G7_9BACL|nr:MULTISPECIES: DUF1641 domain-containing protein [Kyrpidia]HHY67623.1 DUF1641 domain-containing protein [Alicyclobacillus sp.]ATY84289.1 hypothetical protein CVV65_04425 [Kyrpidia spormannii]MCL6577509.1 DUF1641 domain-containing protein [Kyrpidia sp.]CAB3390847.1 conserved protein of unknown function [Kyrpidia spormannii]CAB3391759.1 conserved protein of unknown function [Kyrpidia spormannii]
MEAQLDQPNRSLAELQLTEDRVAAVEGLLAKLGTLDTALTLAHMAADAMTDETIDHMTEKLEKASVLLDVLSDSRLPGLLDKLLAASESLGRLLDRIVQMEKNGSLNKLLDLAETAGILTDAMTEPTLELVTQKMLRGVETLDRVETALNLAMAEDARTPAARIGAMGLLGMLKEPEMQTGIRVLRLFLKHWFGTSSKG